MPQTEYTEQLPIFKANTNGICPYCHTFITKGSTIVRLSQPEQPWTRDGITCWRTGGHYHYDGRRISTREREYAHWTCYKEILILLAETGEGCWYCQSKNDLTIDHLKPTSQGGPDTPGNITVACRSCNSSKNARPYAEYVATLPIEHQQRINR